MTDQKPTSDIIEQYLGHITNGSFPCIAAKAAVAKQQLQCLVVDHMACPKDDATILQFLYDFVDQYRSSATLYHSAAVIFKGPETSTEEDFDQLLWTRLQALYRLDAKNFNYDPRVASDPKSPDFSFSLKEEAFFVIGLHPNSSRPARRFKYPVMTFNPHAQFEQLRDMKKFENMQRVVRKRDLEQSGSVNPMLKDYGEVSEVYQYSGRHYDNQWECPLKINRT
ncbi:MAG: YqcI/YcgG family protein [Weeksellaceae bacterium]|nr:YqcI/YcgG family protein [Weeksellaceae bacterium]